MTSPRTKATRGLTTQFDVCIGKEGAHLATVKDGVRALTAP